MSNTDKTLAQLLKEQHRASQRIKAQRVKVARHQQLLAKFQAVRAARSKEIRKLASGPQKALKWELAQVGTVESPYGSNKGLKVNAWQRVFGIDGSPWCGAFQGNGLKAAGLDVTSRIVYVPYVVADAKAGINGMAAIVPIAQAKAGDLICFDWQGDGVFDHVGMVRTAYDGKGILYTVEGNTSFDDKGSQSNGGCVALKSRPVFSGMTIVRPRYSA